MSEQNRNLDSNKQKFETFCEEIKSNKSFDDFGFSFAMTYEDFIKIRNKLVQCESEEIILVGQSLYEAFSMDRNIKGQSILAHLLKQIDSKTTKKIQVFISEPTELDSFSNSALYETPISRLDATMSTILDNIVPRLNDEQHIDIFFIPFIHLDHMVFVDDYMLLRNTLLWTKHNEYKSIPLLCKNVPGDSETVYHIYKDYVDKLRDNSVKIEVLKALQDHELSNLSDAKRAHAVWRNKIINNNYGKKVTLHRLYRRQILSVIHGTWHIKFRSYSKALHWDDDTTHFVPSKNGKIKTKGDLYNPVNLIGDLSQRILLPYIKETEKLLQEVVRKFDSKGFAEIYPCFDVGFPNNITRLYGGFATGLLVSWKSGTPIVPVDATVNTCSSTMFEVNLEKCDITECFKKEKIQNIIAKGSEKRGYAFSFTTGNHFLMLTKDRATKKYYLIMHSSARQFKDAFIGLYPQEGNWYYNKIKTMNNLENGRSIRYLKDKEAEDFIFIARMLNKQNEEIHNWFAKQLFGDAIIDGSGQFHHHYCMPNDYSVAIGAYVVETGTEVPIFTRKDFPIYTFKPDESMWGIILDGKKQHIVPHGWGQELKTVDVVTEDVENVNSVRLTNGEQNLGLQICNDNNEPRIEIVNCDDDNVAVHTLLRDNKESLKNCVKVRNLCDDVDIPFDLSEEKIVESWNGYMEGKICKVLIPVALYSADTKDEEGGIKYYSA